LDLERYFLTRTSFFKMGKYLKQPSVKKIINNWFTTSYVAKQTIIKMLLLVIDIIGIFSQKLKMPKIQEQSWIKIVGDIHWLIFRRA